MLQNNNVDLADRGHSIILPLSHSGSACHIYQFLQDLLTICQDCGKPDLFVTMTANTAWPEITENLLPGLWMWILDVGDSYANAYK